MIAESGFTQGPRGNAGFVPAGLSAFMKAKAAGWKAPWFPKPDPVPYHPKPAPGSFAEWIAKNGHLPLSELKAQHSLTDYSAPAPAAPGKLYGAGVKLIVIDDPEAVTMEFHLKQLETTGAAEFKFGYRIGFLVATALFVAGTWLSHRFHFLP